MHLCDCIGVVEWLVTQIKAQVQFSLCYDLERASCSSSIYYFRIIIKKTLFVTKNTKHTKTTQHSAKIIIHKSIEFQVF